MLRVGRHALASAATLPQVGGRAITRYSSDAAAQFLRDFHTHRPGQTLTGDTPQAYDAAMVLITAIKHLIRTGQLVTRQAMIE
jgi:hypothetical protein